MLDGVPDGSACRLAMPYVMHSPWPSTARPQMRPPVAMGYWVVQACAPAGLRGGPGSRLPTQPAPAPGGTGPPAP